MAFRLSRENIIGGGEPSGFYAGRYRDPETGECGPEIWLPERAGEMTCHVDDGRPGPKISRRISTRPASPAEAHAAINLKKN